MPAASPVTGGNLRHPAGNEDLILLAEPSGLRFPVIKIDDQRKAAPLSENLFQNPAKLLTFGTGKHRILDQKVHPILLREADLRVFKHIV